MSLFFMLPTSKSRQHVPVAGAITSDVSGNTQAGIRFNTDGTIDVYEGGWQYERDWITPNTGFTASEWEVEVATNTGSGITLTNEDSGYFAISTTRTFEDTSVNGFHNVTWNVTVREVSNTANSETFTLTINAEL